MSTFFFRWQYKHTFQQININDYKPTFQQTQQTNINDDKLDEMIRIMMKIK